MPSKNKSLATIFPAGRGAERGINRLKVIGITALLVCLAIAAYGLMRQQAAMPTAETTQNKPWTSQR